MRYFILGFLLLCVAVVSIAGFRGSISRKPPIEIFPDMDRQPKLRPQAPFGFFADNRSSRQPVAGTVAHRDPWPNTDVNPFEDHPINTGRLVGSTNFVETNPFPVTREFMARGEQRFQVSCAPCHGAQADGNGITKKVGAMAIVANLHDPRIVRQADGEIFSTITYGKNLMGAYGPLVEVPDRWAIIAYLRALQRSRLGTVEDVPADLRSKLPDAPPAQAAAEAKK